MDTVTAIDDDDDNMMLIQMCMCVICVPLESSQNKSVFSDGMYALEER